MMGQQKPLLQLFTLIFFLSCFLPLGSLASKNEEALQVKAANQVISSEVMEEFVNERMDIEWNDYPGSGANNRHDPRSPGRD